MHSVCTYSFCFVLFLGVKRSRLIDITSLTPPHISVFVLLAVNHGKLPKQEDSYAFEEDSSSESLSPEQHHSDESQGSACPSSEAVGSTASSSSSPALTSPRQVKKNTHTPPLHALFYPFLSLKLPH